MSELIWIGNSLYPRGLVYSAAIAAAVIIAIVLAIISAVIETQSKP